MSASTRTRSWLRRVLVIALTVVLGVPMLAAGAYALACYTAFGRERVRQVALEQLAPVLSGRIDVAEIAALSATGIELSGVRVRDPGGAVALEADRLAVAFSPLSLLGGWIVFDAVELNGARGHLADFGSGRGLVAAFMPRDSGEEEPATDEAPSPVRLRIAAIALEDVAFDLELPESGLFGVSAAHARASFRMDETLAVQVDSLRAAVERDGRGVGSIDALSGRYVTGGVPSRIELAARVADSRLELSGEGVVPGEPGADEAPLRASLKLDALDARLLAAVGQAELGERLRQPVRVALTLAGRAADLRADFVLESAAGRAHGRATLVDQSSAGLELAVEELALGDLFDDVPAHRVSLSLSAEADLAHAPQAIPVRVTLRSGALDGLALPQLRAEGRLSPGRVEALALRAEGYGGTLFAQGEVAFDGAARGTLALSLPSLQKLPASLRARAPDRADGSLSAEARVVLQQGRIDLRGEVKARQLSLAGVAARSIDAKVSAEGDPSAPRVSLDLAAVALRHDDLALDSVSLALDGGPERYKATLDARATQGRLHAELAALRRPEAVELELSARGDFAGERFGLSLRRARIGYDGAIGVRGLSVSALGQELEADGRLSRDGTGEAEVAVSGLDLALLSAALGQPQAGLAGKLRLRAELSGSLAAPVARVSLDAVELALGPGPRASFDAELGLDCGAGRASLVANLASGAALALGLDGEAEFAAGARASWSQRLESLRYDAVLELSRLDSRLVEAFRPGEPALPGRARVNGRVHASGTLQEPRVEGELYARLRAQGQRRVVELALSPRYAAGEALLEFHARDPDGPWLDGTARLAHPDATTAALVRDAPRALDVASYELALDVAPRRLAQLGYQPGKVDEGRVEVGGSLRIAHAPHAEPSAEVVLSAEHPQSPHAGECIGLQSRLDLVARLADGRADVRSTLLREGDPLITLNAAASLPLSPWLSAGEPVRLSDVGGEARVEGVELASLPFICGKVRGELSGLLRAERVLSPRPQLVAKLAAKHFSLAKPYMLDLALDAKAGAERAELDLAIAHEGRKSVLSARVPLRIRDHLPEVPEAAALFARLRLDRLPVGALVPPSLPVSRVTGRVSGRLELGGTRAAPDLRGQLEAQSVGLTATAIAQPLSDINGRIVFGERVIRIERLVARDGDGTLQADGTVKRAAQGGLDIAAELEAREFPLRQQGRVAGMLDARAALDIGLHPEQTRAVVTLHDVSIWLRGGSLRKGIDLERHPDIVDPRMAAVPDEETDDEPSVPLSLTLDAQDSLWVRRDDFAVKLSMKLSVEQAGESIRVEGPVTLNRGFLLLLGKDFTIVEGSRLEFTGKYPPDPVLAIEAYTDNRRTGRRVGVRIGGFASAPELEFLIDGVVETPDKAAYELFGSSEGAGGAASAQVQSFASGLTGGILGVTARRQLGDLMPILVVEPGAMGKGARVRAGFELDSLVPGFMKGLIRGVYLEGIYAGSEDEEQDAEGGVLLELYLPENFVTSGQYGPGQTWSVDLGWEP